MNEYRLPPQNIEAEESILVSCLLSSDSAECAASVLQPKDFYRSDHQKIFETILRLRQKKEPVDIITIVSALKESGRLEEVGGVSKLYSMTTEVPVASSVEFTAKLIKDKAQARRFLEIANNCSDQVYQSNGNLSEILDHAQSQILGIGLDIKSENFIHMRDLTMESVDRYQALRERKKDTGIKTGFPSIDSLTGGFRGSKLVIIAARPKIGKTAFAQAITRNMAKAGHKVGFFELEMDKEELDDRWMAMETGINSMCFATGTGPNNSQWPAIQEAAGRKYTWQIIVDDTGGQSIGELKRRIRKMVKMGCEIVFVDQLSKIRGGDAKKSSWETTTEHVVELKQITKELKTPVVLLVQLNRQVDDRKPPRPTTADFKLTGAIEEEADIAFLGYRKHPYTKNPDDLNHALWDLALHRGGPTRAIPMHWEPKTTLFTEADSPKGG